MDTVHVIVLAIIQGVTEFLPISSSGHLALIPHLFGWQDQGLSFDVAVHIGTLLAVLSYFRHELIDIVRDTLLSLTTQQHTNASRLGRNIILATLPVGVFGLALKGLIEANLRTALVVGLATIIFGLLLGLADRSGRKSRSLDSLTWQDALLIGLAQALALIPGTSRSGATITAALLLGFERQAAARFSFLMAIPTIALAGGLLGLEVWHNSAEFDLHALLLGVVLSALTAYACIHWFMGFLKRYSMLPFVIYRLVLGTVILILLA